MVLKPCLCFRLKMWDLMSKVFYVSIRFLHRRKVSISSSDTTPIRSTLSSMSTTEQCSIIWCHKLKNRPDTTTKAYLMLNTKPWSSVVFMLGNERQYILETFSRVKFRLTEQSLHFYSLLLSKRYQLGMCWKHLISCWIIPLFLTGRLLLVA